MKQTLDDPGRVRIFAGAGHHGGNAQRHLPGETRPGQHSHTLGLDLLTQNAAHCLTGFKFNALGHADHDCAMPLELTGDRAETLGRDGQNEALPPLHRHVKVRLHPPS